MPTFGHLKRDFPRLEVLRGFDPNEPRTQTAAYRVKSGQTILSGMVVTPTWNAADNVYEWTVGMESATAPVYFALQDSADADVLEAGNLVGLSCAGQFELQTAFYDVDGVYNEGILLCPMAPNDDNSFATYYPAATGSTLGVNNDAAVAALGRTSNTEGNANGFLTTVTRATIDATDFVFDASDANGRPQIVGQVTRAAGSAGDGVAYNSLDGINSNVVFKKVITFRTVWQPALAAKS